MITHFPFIYLHQFKINNVMQNMTPYWPAQQQDCIILLIHHKLSLFLYFLKLEYLFRLALDVFIVMNENILWGWLPTCSDFCLTDSSRVVFSSGYTHFIKRQEIIGDGLVLTHSLPFTFLERILVQLNNKYNLAADLIWSKWYSSLVKIQKQIKI